MHRDRASFLTVLAVLFFVTTGLCSAKSPSPPDPRPTLEAFCKAEFDGNEDAYTMVTLSALRQAAFHKKFPGENISIGNMISGPYDCAPVLVARSYRVLGLTVKGKTAVAEVEYEVAGEFRRLKENLCANEFISYGKKTQRETLNLRYSNGKNGMGWIRGTAWYVEDPPNPKVSIVAMLSICQKKLNNYRSIASNEQRGGRAVPSNITEGIEIFEKKVQILQGLSHEGNS
jgi:hypothetical protein